MDINEKIRMAEEISGSLCGRCITRDGIEYPLTVGEVTNAMDGSFRLISRRMAETYLKESGETASDADLDRLSSGCADEMMSAIGPMLEKAVRDRLKNLH